MAHIKKMIIDVRTKNTHEERITNNELFIFCSDMQSRIDETKIQL